MDARQNQWERREADRRRERRYEVAGRMWWARGETEERYAGWLSDASAGSVSFITSAEARPRFGEEVELITGVTGAPPRGRVERVSAYDEHLCLVACRRIH